MNSINPRDEPLDLPPEFCIYKDEGCQLAKSCLDCPFPRCVDDRPRGRRKWPREQRNKEIARLHIEEKKTVREIAASFNVNMRTVYRALTTNRKR